MSEIINLTGYSKKSSMRVERHFISLDRMNDDSIIIDAGACVGDVINDLRKHRQMSRCKIFAIECDKKNVEYLKKQNFFNVEICEKALVGQEVERSVKFFSLSHRPNWGSIEPAGLSERWKRTGESYHVKTLKINDIFGEFGIDKIDYMKMDVEGSEKMILDTMSVETARKIKQLSVEIHWPNPHAEITMEWAERQLTRLGFEVRILDRVEIFCERI